MEIRVLVALVLEAQVLEAQVLDKRPQLHHLGLVKVDLGN